MATNGTKYIATTDKVEFLKREWDQSKMYRETYPSFGEFYENIGDAIEPCVHCKIWYWQGCMKRCNCSER